MYNLAHVFCDYNLAIILINQPSMEYLLSNLCTKNYWNQTTTVLLKLSLVVGWYTRNVGLFDVSGYVRYYSSYYGRQ